VIPRHLYIHAPFCARRCSYCDFAVTVERSPRAKPWLDAIERELARLVARYGWDRLELRTIYIGGGTPSLFGQSVMADLATRLRGLADLSTLTEWTAEANPEHFGPALAEDWREAGIGRVSFGAQTFDPAVLSWMGRMHGPDGPGRAVRIARAAGFDDVSVDLIFGLPSRFERDWTADLRKAIELGTEHVSLYGLTAEAAAPLGRWVAEGRERLADEDAYAAEYLEAAETLARAGFGHYEVSNFAKPGRESRHNQAYWDGRAYIGLGPGAHSSLPPHRWWNVRDHATWAARIAAGKSPVDGEETVEGESAALEQAWLRLRTWSGAVSHTAAQRELAVRWRDAGLAVVDGDRVVLTAAGWLLLDRLAVELAERGLSGDGAAETLVDRTFRTEACSTG
jgi:oxygen-independent coproporphyrinogen-3 oxidase